MMNQQEKSFLIQAVRTEFSERSIAQLRAIKSGAAKFDNMVINEEVLNCSAERLDVAIGELAPLVEGVEKPDVLRELVFDWAPDRTGIREVYKDVVKIIDSAGWNADHSDGVDEKIRREQYAKRREFTEVVMLVIAIKFAEVFWSRFPMSVVVVNTLNKIGAFDFVLGRKGVSEVKEGAVTELFDMLDRWGRMGSAPDVFDVMVWPLVALIAKMEEDRMSNVRVSDCIKGGSEINMVPKNEVEWLVDGMIPKTVEADKPYVGFLYGNSSTYKSFIATGICAALVKGNRNAAGFAGMAKVDSEPMNILYLSGEDSAGVRIRLEVELGEKLPDNVRMNLVELDSVYDSTGAFDPAICRAVIDHDPDLIVMDTMNSLKLCESNNSSSAVSRMMHQLKGLGTTVMVIHHSTKGGDSMEGSHAMFSNADFVLRTDVVEREDDIPVVDLSCAKLKNAAKFKTMRIELVDKFGSLVCRNHKVYEESREEELDSLGLDKVLTRIIHESGADGMTPAQLVNHSEVKYDSCRNSLSKYITRNIDKSNPVWSGIVKVSKPGLETKYILESEYKG